MGNRDLGSLEPLSGPRVYGYARWRKDWVKVFSEFAQDCRALGASIKSTLKPTHLGYAWAPINVSFRLQSTFILIE